MDKGKLHMELLKKLNKVYIEKNNDYGDSFSKARKDVPNYTLGKLYDKFERYKNITLNGNQQVKDEAIEDTLLDMANYAIMEVMELDLEKSESLGFGLVDLDASVITEGEISADRITSGNWEDSLKFKVGDRVRKVKEGYYGVIMEVDEESEDLNYKVGLGNSTEGIWFDEEDLELIE